MAHGRPASARLRTHAEAVCAALVAGDVERVIEELSQELRAIRPSLKVLYMSGYTEKTIVHHGVVDPGIAFLHKPFTSDALGLKIREVLDRS